MAVFIDFQGVYDTIWRSRLLNKLHVHGIGGKIYNWRKIIFIPKMGKTRWNEQESNYKKSKVGLPQGAVSNCTFFNIYIKELVTKLKSIKVCMFADNMVIWAEAASYFQKI